MEICQASGNTPLVYLRRISRIRECHIYVKYEAANAGGSAAARIAGAYVAEAIESGRLQRGGCAVAGNVVASEQWPESGDMVAMLVGDEDAAEIFHPAWRLRLHTGHQSFQTDAAVDEKGAGRAREIITVALAAAC